MVMVMVTMVVAEPLPTDGSSRTAAKAGEAFRVRARTDFIANNCQAGSHKSTCSAFLFDGAGGDRLGMTGSTAHSAGKMRLCCVYETSSALRSLE
jgi:hypothetical protein